MAKSKLRVGFDFDGVVAYNPFRIVRGPISLVKKKLFGVRKLQFWYPQARWQQIFWIVLHQSSILPARGIDLFKKLVNEDLIEAHLVTARYSFLDDHLYNWLNKNGLRQHFSSINLNKNDEQPHIFKDRLIKKHNLDFFIEDNLDIVKFLHGRNRTKIYWIYNILDRGYPHPYKHPFLESALESIMQNAKIKPAGGRTKRKKK